MKKLRKVLFIFVILFLVVGCGNMMNTPTKKVEEFLSKYQTMSEDVLSQLDTVIKDAGNFTDNQKADVLTPM